MGENGSILYFDGVDWLHQTIPSTEGLVAVWGNSPAQVFALGDAGTIIHFDGLEWNIEPNAAPLGLRAVWGSSAVDVWAVGATNERRGLL